MIGAADDHALGFAVAPGPSPLVALLDGSVRDTTMTGAVAEVCPAALSLMHAIATRIERHRGAALVFDYGYESGSNGDTLQAVRGHAKVGIFDRIGESDLTTHVDFAALARAAREAGAAVDGPVTQGAFLRQLGIATRACALQARASPTQAAGIESAMARLIAPDQMGTLFRVLAVRDRAASPASGFAPDSTALESSPGPPS
jgi:NADH dehydrogenase [ubiquinone] 1 alpha subcomplex assembly factor 7